jgi:tetratricopeptide (TPR) repeat protein
MNKLSLITALVLGAGGAQGHPALQQSTSGAGTASQAISDDVRGPAARGDASSAWEASGNAEAAGKLDVALSVLANLPVAQRNGYLATFRRGWLQYRLAHYVESVVAYRSAVGKEPAALEARLALLLPLMALTKWQDVSQVAEDVLKVDPENYLALQRLALAKFSTRRFAEAEVLYRRLLVLYPSDIEMRSALGWTVLRMGKQAQAAALFTQVLDVAGSHVGATRGLQEAGGNKAER